MIQDFLTYLRALKGYSENTCEAYRRDLEHFCRYMRQKRQGARWSNITREDIDAYVIDMQAEGMKPATTNRHLASISAFYRYIMRQGLDVKNPCKYESRRKIAETIPTTIPTEAIVAAWQTTQGAGKGIIGLIATTGMRISEVLNLHYNDIDWNTGSITVHGKGDKERVVKTSQAVLNIWREKGQPDKLTCKIFTINQRTARRIVYESLRPHTSCKHLNPHSIRHTFATQLALRGVDTITIAKTLGHKNISTSQKYVDMTQIASPTMGISLTN